MAQTVLFLSAHVNEEFRTDIRTDKNFDNHDLNYDDLKIVYDLLCFGTRV